MIRWLVTLVWVALIVCPPTVAAQSTGEPQFQTANGQQSWSALVTQLLAAGYPGPWDPASATAAYARASGGAVTILGGQPLATLPKLAVVVELGGVGTDATPGGPWTVLEPYLQGPFSFRRYQYDTCGDINFNVQQLTNYVQTLRPNRVILVGHSMGGVVALSAIGNADLSGVVQGVVIADAPINGLSEDLVSFGESVGIVPAPCPALDQLIDTASWSDASSAAAQRALDEKIGVLDIVNSYDNMVPLAAQQLPQTQLNARFDVSSGSGFINHTAIFTSPAALSAIAQFIRSL